MTACKGVHPWNICPGLGKVRPNCSGKSPLGDDFYQGLSHIFSVPACKGARPRLIGEDGNARGLKENMRSISKNANVNGRFPLRFNEKLLK